MKPRVGNGMVRVGMGAAYTPFPSFLPIIIWHITHTIFTTVGSDLGVTYSVSGIWKSVYDKFGISLLLTFLLRNLFSICSLLSFTTFSRVEHLEKPTLTSLIVCALTSYPPPPTHTYPISQSFFSLLSSHLVLVGVTNTRWLEKWCRAREVFSLPLSGRCGREVWTRYGRSRDSSTGRRKPLSRSLEIFTHKKKA